MIAFLIVLANVALNSFVYSHVESIILNENARQVDIELGRRQFEILRQESEFPKYGTCWKKALINLQTGCKNLNDDVQSRLALGFTNCFLQKAGLDTYSCMSQNNITECLKPLTPTAFHTFTTFFTHTHSLCFFLQNQIWHEENLRTISKLEESSSEVSERLEHAGKIQEKILETQHSSLKTQEKLIERSEQLDITLQNSKENVKEIIEQFQHSKDKVREVLSEFQSSTHEQRLLIFEVFDRISSLQSLVLGELTGFYSIVFHIIASIFIYLLTSSSRTHAARFWMLAMVILNFAVERILSSWGSYDSVTQEVPDLNNILYEDVWWCRKITSFICLSILGVSVYNYIDYNYANNRLLVEIREQNTELQRVMQTLGNYNESFHLNGSRSLRNGSEDSESDISYDDSDSSEDEEEDRKTLTWKTPFILKPVADFYNHLTEGFHPRYETGAVSAMDLEGYTVKNLSSSENEGTVRYNLRKRSVHQIQNPILTQETPEEFALIINQLELNTKLNSLRMRSLITSDDEMSPT